MELQYITRLPGKEAFFQLYETTGWNEEKGFSADDLNRAIHNSWYFISVLEGEKLVGCGRIVSDGVYQTLIGDLIVHPDYQQRGIGSKVLDLLVEKCKAEGIKWIQLTSAEGKAGFYKKHGFQERPADGPGMEKLL